MLNDSAFSKLVLAAVTICSSIASNVCAQKAERSSSAPPQDAIILFDGSNQDAWLGQTYKKWEESDGPADWKIVDGGVLEVVPNAGSLITRQKFGDFTLHFEFRLPKGEVNGGVFLQARYEFGIKGSSGAPQGLACGSFENLKKPVHPSAKVLSPPNEWQTVDIDFRAPRFDEHGKLAEKARATVRLNGVLIHDDVELGDRKGAAKRLGDASTGPIMLQDHGQTYAFRNIWIIDESAR
jgi:hypothetical protein